MNLRDIYLEYNIIGTIYISDFFNSNGSNLIFNQLQSLHRDRYEHNDRIAVVYNCPDRYSYADHPGDAITALQKYLTQLDITNCFVLAISSIPSVADDCDRVQKLYSTDTWAIEFKLVKDLPTSTQIDNNVRDTFCVLPWMHLYVGPDSNVLPCCVADQKFPMGSINDQPVAGILKSTKFNQLRKNMLEGRQSKECSRCYLKEDSGMISERQRHNARWALSRSTLDPDGNIDQFSPVYLDIRLNNICNFKCRMCSGYYSSSIAQEDAKLFANAKPIDTIMSTAEKNLALNEIIQYLPHAEKIYFAGGEPLLAPEHYKILNALADCGNTNLEIVYNTNFSVLTYKNVSVIELWSKFSNVTIMASVDAIGPIAEYVRHGTVWSDIETNVDIVKTQCPHVNIVVTSTVGLLNASSLIELQKNWHENNVLDISKFSLSAMVGPEHLTVCALPEHHKARLSRLISQHIQWCHKHQANKLAKEWQNVVSYMMSQDLSHQLPEFKRLTLTMDQHRGQSLVDVLPEYHDIME